MIPVPHDVQRRAWECACVLHDDHLRAMPIADAVAVVVAYREGPEAVSWATARNMLGMARQYLGVRV